MKTFCDILNFGKRDLIFLIRNIEYHDEESHIVMRNLIHIKRYSAYRDEENPHTPISSKRWTK